MSMVSSGIHILAKATQAVSTTSARLAIGVQHRGRDVFVHNPSAGVLYANLGGDTVEAAVTDYPIPAGQVRKFRIADGHTHIALRLSASTATATLFYGEGDPLA